VAKHRIDDILQRRASRSGEDRRDAAPAPGDEAIFSPLPERPAAQADEPSTAAPAPEPEPATPRGDLSIVFELDPAESSAGGSGLGELVITRGAVTREQLGAAEQILKQSPGRRLAEVLSEQGADEALLQQAVADACGIAFERVDLEKGLDGGFDGKMLQRLTPEYLQGAHDRARCGARGSAS
jgi:hypothetical protein